MTRKNGNDQKIRREESDLEGILGGLPGNPIDWVTVVKLVAPILSRLAVRYALKKTKRGMSEDRVNRVGTEVANFIANIVAKRTA